MGALASALNQLHKCLAGGLFLFALEPGPHVLHPVKRFTQLGKALTPLVTRDQLVDIELVGRFQPTFAQLLSRFGFLWSQLFLHRTSDLVQHIHGLLDDVEAVDNVHLVAKDRFDGGKEGLGHISHDHFHPIAFVLGPALEPGNDIVSASALKGGDGLALIQVDHHCVVPVPLASGVCVNANGSTELAGATATAPVKRPAEHGACGETVALGKFSTRATAETFLSHSGVETLSPLDVLAEGCTPRADAGNRSTQNASDAATA